MNHGYFLAALVQDDPSLYGYNVPELVDLFVAYVKNQVTKGVAISMFLVDANAANV